MEVNSMTKGEMCFAKAIATVVSATNDYQEGKKKSTRRITDHDHEYKDYLKKHLIKNQKRRK